MTLYLNVPGIPGTVSHKEYKNWISASSLYFEVDRFYHSPRHLSPPMASEIVLVKAIDAASPQLFTQACIGNSLEKIIIDFPTLFLRYDLTNVLVSEYFIYVDAHQNYEWLGLNFTHLEMRYLGPSPPHSVKVKTGCAPSSDVRLRRGIQNKTTEGFNLFVATVWGEAASQSEIAWQAVASVIVNRVNNKRFQYQIGSNKHKKLYAKYSDTNEVIEISGFDAYKKRTREFKLALNYLEGHAKQAPKNLERMIVLLKPIYYQQQVITDATLYYSPAAQHKLHIKRPQEYDELPKWKFYELNEIKIIGLHSSDDFRFFKYKQGNK